MRRFRAAPLAAVVPVRDVVGWVGEGHGRPPAVQEARHGRCVRRVAAQEAVVSQLPQVARLGHRGGLCGLQGSIQVEGLYPLPLLPRVERLQQLVQLFLGEAGEGEVDILNRWRSASSWAGSWSQHRLSCSGPG
jgi:hypothetical protein